MDKDTQDTIRQYKRTYSILLYDICACLIASIVLLVFSFSPGLDTFGFVMGKVMALAFFLLAAYIFPALRFNIAVTKQLEKGNWLEIDRLLKKRSEFGLVPFLHKKKKGPKSY